MSMDALKKWAGEFPRVWAFTPASAADVREVAEILITLIERVERLEQRLGKS